jgi:Fumarylacetoacetase N-terminal
MNGHKVIPHPIPVPDNSDFPIQNIPFGIFSPKSSTTSTELESNADQRRKRACTIVGDNIVDLAILEQAGYFREVFALGSPGGGEGIFNQVSASSHGKHFPVKLCISESATGGMALKS